MKKRQIELGALKISDKAKRYVNSVLDSGRLSYGEYSKKFEELFAKRHDCKFAVVTNSGTSALHVAIAALKIKYEWSDDSEIIVPATTFVATINTIIHNNLRPVLVDVDPTYYELNSKLIEEKITPKTKAIIPVHLFGLPCEMNEICKISKRYGLKIIEDSCECMLAEFNGKKVGSFGEIGCFSTYMAHIMTTGVGGICTTNDIDLAILLRSLNNHGRDSIYISIDDDNDKHGKELKEIISKRFSFIYLGHSFRLTEMEWAIGLAQLEDELDKIIDLRQRNFDYLTKQLMKNNLPIIFPSKRQNSTHSCMIYPLVLKSKKINKNSLLDFLEENGLETRELLPILNQPIYRNMSFIKGNYPVAENLIKNGFYIGCHQYLTKDDLDYIVELLSRYCNEKEN